MIIPAEKQLEVNDAEEDRELYRQETIMFGAMVAIYLRVTIHLANARLLGMGILVRIL